MKKNELVNLHGLFDLLRTQFEVEYEWFDGSFEAYERLGVRPTHIHRSKEKHRHAVVLLSEGIANELAANGKYGVEGETTDAASAES